MQIYLDHSATTPPRDAVIRAMEIALKKQWGNPSSLHQWGERSTLAMETARIKIANLIHAHPESIIFTSGGTESDNLAILGVASFYDQPQHIIISSVEHSAVLAPVKFLEKKGWEISYLPVNTQGKVTPLDLQKALRPNTIFVSIISGQSEVGTIQPIDELGKIARDHGVLFHTDAVQTIGRIPINVEQLPIDLLSLSSHKIYGPQGIGALYVRPEVQLIPLIKGGGQELNLRSGTPAIPNIVGLGIAAELAQQEMAEEMPRLTQLRDYLFDLLSPISDLIPTGDRQDRLPHHVSFCFLSHSPNITGRTLVRQMNLAGIAISSGSACQSGKLNASPTLLAMGYSEEQALGAIRFTLGRETTCADIEWTAMVFKQILERLFINSLVLQ